MAAAGAEWNQRSFGRGGRAVAGGRGGKGAGAPAAAGGKGEMGAPPPGYICFRCNKSGHFIQNCPTNGDTNFDASAKRRAPVGIPRSQLREVEVSADGEKVGCPFEPNQNERGPVP